MSQPTSTNPTSANPTSAAPTSAGAVGVEARSAPSLFARVRAFIRNPAFIYLCALTLSRGAAFVLIPLYTRRLTPIEYGQYALGQTLLGLFPGMMSLGLQGAVSRFYFEPSDVAVGQHQAGSVARWHLCFVLVSVVVMETLVALVWPDQGSGIGGKRELAFLAVACGGSALSMIPGNYLRARQRPMMAAIFQVLEFTVVMTSALLLVRVYDRGLRGAFEAYGIAYGTMGTIGAVFILSLPGRLSFAMLKRALPFSLPLVPHLFANQLQNVADRWTMEVTGLHAQLGPYALATQLTQPVGIVIGSYNDAAGPQMGETYREGGLAAVERTIGAVRRRYLLVAAAGSALIVAALPIAKLLIGDKFHQALWISPFLCGVYLIETLYYPNVNVVYFAGRTRAIPRITLSAAALNVVLNVVFIRFLGVGGAVLARAASMAYRSFGMWLAARSSFAAPPAIAEVATENR